MSEDFAVVKIGGRQYKVKPGDKFEVEKIEGKKGDACVFDEVLLLSKDSKLVIGTPTVKNIQVAAEIVDQVKGKKVIAFKYKAKSRYRKRKGHRQKYTKIEIKKFQNNK